MRAQDSGIGLLLIDDHAFLRDGLAALIASQPDMHVASEADSAEAALEILESYSPDVTLLDLRLPGAQGTDMVRRIRAVCASTKIIVLTNSQGSDEIIRALEAGASGYLFKTAARQDLLAAIRAAHAGRKYIPQNVALKMTEQMPRIELSKRELDVLQLVARGMRNKEIADTLRIAEPTVKEHVRGILSKLNVNDRTAAVTAALTRGILELPA